VWADLDGDQVVFMTSADTVKGKAILRDPRVPLRWDDERPPFRFVRPSPARSPRRTAGRSSWRSPAPAATGPRLREALGQLQSGDTLVIYKPGRVTRPMKQLLVLPEDQLRARGINLRILTGICAEIHRPDGATIADKMLIGGSLCPQGYAVTRRSVTGL
jgi:hypothetical protein